MPRITKRVIDALEATAGEGFVWDSTLPGFGARKRESGVVTYVIQYRNAAGQTRRMALGRHGVLAPEKARKLAVERLGAVAGGHDPAQEKRAAREVGQRLATLTEVVALWREFQSARVAKGKLRERTLEEYVRQLQREILPRLGRRRLAELAPGDVQTLHDAFTSRPVLGNRVVDLLSAVWNWAEARGHASGPNPCRRVDRNEEQRRTRHLSQEELGRLGAELGRLATARKVPPRVALLVRLIALTGCRPGEVKSLAWADVELGASVLHLRNAKTGDRDVWLSEPAKKTLEAVRALPVRIAPKAGKGRKPAGSPWVFPSCRDQRRHVGEFRKPWASLLKGAKIEHAEPYILRHTFASHSEALGHSAYLTAALLGHSTGRMGMTAGYVHHIPEDVRRASERVSRRIAAALDGEAPTNVVSIHEAARG